MTLPDTNDWWIQILHNRILGACFVGWATAQLLKTLFGVIRERRFNFRWFVGSGGMPSSHSALVSALATSVGLHYGFASAFFAAACVFAIVTMFDAQGVRHQSGKQARALNRILDDVYAQRGIQLDPLKELFGHTPVEVLAGAAIGIAVANFIM